MRNPEAGYASQEQIDSEHNERVEALYHAMHELKGREQYDELGALLLQFKADEENLQNEIETCSPNELRTTKAEIDYLRDRIAEIKDKRTEFLSAD